MEAKSFCVSGHKRDSIHTQKYHKPERYLISYQQYIIRESYWMDVFM